MSVHNEYMSLSDNYRLLKHLFNIVLNYRLLMLCHCSDVCCRIYIKGYLLIHLLTYLLTCLTGARLFLVMETGFDSISRWIIFLMQKVQIISALCGKMRVRFPPESCMIFPSPRETDTLGAEFPRNERNFKK